jgi:hypothetical protein
MFDTKVTPVIIKVVRPVELNGMIMHFSMNRLVFVGPVLGSNLSSR